MRRNVLFISSWFPNKVEPTNGNFVQRHAEAVALKNNVEILHSIGNFHQNETFVFDEKVVNGIKTLIVYYKNTNNPLINFTRRMSGYKKGFERMKLPEIVHANVLHNSMFFAVYLKKKFKIPFVLTEHWTAYQENAEDAHGKFWRFFANKIANEASYVFPVSENLKKGLVTLGVKTPMKVVSNVVNLDIFYPRKKQKEKFTFLHISNLIERKNPLKIIKAAIELKNEGFDFVLEIGGDTEKHEEEIVKTYIQEKKAENYIRIFGKLSYEEVAEKMNNSDCFILFSDSETQGCVLIESIGCGIPVISTNVGGIPEYVTPEFGILIDKGDEAVLKAAMKKMLKHEQSFASEEEMQKYAQNTYGREAVAEKYSEVYNQILQ